MRYRTAAILLMALAVLAVVEMVVKTRQNTTPASTVQIHLTSDPFPSAVGSETFYVSLTGSDGVPVANAAIEVSANMMMPVMLPLAGRALSQSGSKNQYPVSIIWPMAGQWEVDVKATLPDQTVVQDQFDLYVYGVPPMRVEGETSYRSASEIKAEVSANAAHEYWIEIPQGTQTLLRSGQGEDLIPAKIHLNLNGQNILVIRNDDIADHTVGPFFIKAGETIRQEFTRAAVFQGKCTIRHGAEVSIIVD